MAELTANEIIKLLEEPTEHRYPIKLRITEEATATELVMALQQTKNELTRQILCDIAGNSLEREAVPTLIQLLYDPSESIRGAVADALGKIGDIRAGPALLELFASRKRNSRDELVPNMVASALGAVGYRPAIPLLIQALEDDDSMIRGLAAWGLGIMCATEAEEALRAALARETEPLGNYVRERLIESLEAVELASTTTTSMKREEAIPILLAALKRKPYSGVYTTCAAWALGKLRAKEGVRPLQRRLTKYRKGFMAEHIQAALGDIRTKN